MTHKGRKKNSRPVQTGKRAAEREFGLLPIPPITNPVGSSRGPTTQILWLPIVPSPIVVGTTSYASALVVNGASVANFSDYAAVWEEYIVRAVEWEWLACGSQNGTFKYYIDEADNSTPTLTTAKKHVGFMAPCKGESGYQHRVRWVAKDVGDETWRATNNTSTFLTALKVYSDSANYGLVGTAETVAVVSGLACVQFRTQGGA